MLRRPATTIKLTPEDILEYDDTIVNEEHDKEKSQQMDSRFFHDQILQEHNSSSIDMIHNFKGTAANQSPKHVVPTREERIGVNMNPNTTN